MKLKTSTALAVAATGAAAQDSWGAWSSTPSEPSIASVTAKDCPATITSIKTETTTCYESTSEVFKSTVTVPLLDKPNSFSMKSKWVDWQTSSAEPQGYSQPAGCSDGKTVTSTSMITSTVAGTTTVTKSILYVGAQATGSTDEAWANWKPADSDAGSGSDTASSSAWSVGSGSGSDKGSNSGSGSSSSNNGWGSGSGYSSGSGFSSSGSDSSSWNPESGSGSGKNGWGSDSGSSTGSGFASDSSNNGWGSGDGISSSANAETDGTNGNDGWGKGSWGGKGTGGQEIAFDNDVFKWDPKPEPELKTDGKAPVYSQNSDGTWSGEAWGGSDGSNGDSKGESSDGEHGNGLSSDEKNSNGSSSGGKNGTLTDGGKNGGSSNGTSPQGDYGSLSSNVTKPFEPLKDSSCNTASDRSVWCDGLDVDTDYYADYWNDLKNVKSADSRSGRQASGSFGGTCNYDLVITNGTWNQDGENVGSFLINGQYPGPAIECNWGDMVTINVHNQLDCNGTAIHWHGIRQVGTNDQDGVPGVTECAIAPGSSRTYSWRASSYGTSWYHSHWNLQYGDGVQGPIIIHGPATAKYDVDAGPVMITDTFGMSATAFGSIVAHVGPLGVDNYLLNGKNTKSDLSAGQHSLWKVQKGKKYLFRLINSAAQNMYSVSIDQHKMKVIAADFVPITPYETDWVNIGIGQRYDVVVEMDQDVETYFFRAVTQTLCPSASNNTGLGQANGIIAYEGVPEHPILLPASTLNGNRTAASFRTCADEPITSLVPHLKKDSGTKSAFQASASTLPGGTVTKVSTTDDGAVFRWFLNNGAMYVNFTQPTLMSLNDHIAANSSVYANHITLNQKDEWVYFVIQNQFVAAHPMHLHGHDFSVLGQGDGLFTASMVDTLNFDNPIRRDTAMLRGSAAPGATSGGYTVIGFETDNPGAWLMHCHIAWHVDGGLSLQWLERPDDMDSYADKPDFKNECSAYSDYEAADESHKKFSGQSGLRKKELTYFDKITSEASRQFGTVVRRDGAAHHHYLDGYLKRGLGDGAHRRTFGRRR